MLLLPSILWCLAIKRRKKEETLNWIIEYGCFFVILHNNNNWHYSLPLDAVKGGAINSITNESNNRMGVSRWGRSPTKWNTNPYRISRRGLHFFRCSPLLFLYDCTGYVIMKAMVWGFMESLPVYWAYRLCWQSVRHFYARNFCCPAYFTITLREEPSE